MSSDLTRVEQELLARWPEAGPGLYLRGVALLRLGRAEAGQAALTEARERLADSPVYQARIAQALGSSTPWAG